MEQSGGPSVRAGPMGRFEGPCSVAPLERPMTCHCVLGPSQRPSREPRQLSPRLESLGLNSSRPLHVVDRGSAEKGPSMTFPCRAHFEMPPPRIPGRPPLERHRVFRGQARGRL
ncbi:hypothetical protein M885DRAFT_287699 [Pelagophyceae sp. CCMP2097]|nr:hypothetical protein M885DRAFT_287699 [Pelagophyceae sp. CCMP2097]